MMHNLMFNVFPNPFPLLILLPLCGWISVKYRSRNMDAVLMMSIIIAPLSLATITWIKSMSFVAPYKYDQYLYLIDLKLGDPTYKIGMYLGQHSFIHGLIAIIYNVLPYELFVIFFAYAWQDNLDEAWRAVRANVMLYGLIVPLYMLVPASGPGFAFPGFPFIRPDISVAHAIALNGAPNCLPSGHLSAALIAIWQCRRWRWGRLLAILFAIGTAIATLGLGGHYVVDLIAAVPYTALIVYLSEGEYEWIPQRNKLSPLETKAI